MTDAMMHSEIVAYWIAKYFNKGLRYRENTIETRTFNLFMFKTSKKNLSLCTRSC